MKAGIHPQMEGKWLFQVGQLASSKPLDGGLSAVVNGKKRKVRVSGGREVWINCMESSQRDKEGPDYVGLWVLGKILRFVQSGIGSH